jgi:hypothetical protein
MVLELDLVERLFNLREREIWQRRMAAVERRDRVLDRHVENLKQSFARTRRSGGRSLCGHRAPRVVASGR